MGAKRVPSGHQVPPARRTGRFIPLQTYTTIKPQDSIHLTCLLDIWSYMSKWLQASFEVCGEESSFKPKHLIYLSSAKAELSCSLMVLVSYPVFHRVQTHGWNKEDDSYSSITHFLTAWLLISVTMSYYFIWWANGHQPPWRGKYTIKKSSKCIIK